MSRLRGGERYNMNSVHAHAVGSWGRSRQRRILVLNYATSPLCDPTRDLVRGSSGRITTMMAGLALDPRISE